MTQMAVLFLITDVISYMKQYALLNAGFTSIHYHALYIYVISNNITDTLSILTELSN